MPTLLETSVLLDSTGDLYHKVRGGVIKIAAAVYGEAVETPNHVNRMAWARDVLLTGNIDSRTKEMYRMCMTNATVVAAGESALESDVEWCINTFLNIIANGGA